MEAYVFNTFLEKRKFLMRLGNYISHKVVAYYDWEKGKRILRTPEELNQLHRLDLAYDFFYNYMYEGMTAGGPGTADIIPDIAVYIDRRIPQAYLKWSGQVNGASPANIDASKYNHGIKYQYPDGFYEEENYYKRPEYKEIMERRKEKEAREAEWR